MTQQNTKIKVNSWKELEALGKQTEQGLLIPPGVHGLSDTHILFDATEEFLFEEKKQLQAIKDGQGMILSAGF